MFFKNKMFFVAALICSASALAQPLKMKDGKVTFLAKGNPGFLSVEGAGGTVEGTLNREGKNITGELLCQMDKFSVPIELRDSHMKEKVLRIKDFPQSRIKLTSFEVSDAGTADKKPFKGLMKIRDVEKPVEGVATLDKAGLLTADLKISLKEFGFEPIKYASVKMMDEVSIQVTGALLEEKGGNTAAAPVKKP